MGDCLDHRSHDSGGPCFSGGSTVRTNKRRDYLAGRCKENPDKV